VRLANEVECDEAYVVAGHKGQPGVVKSQGRKGRRRQRKSKSGRGTMAKEKPPIFGMIERGGQVVIHLLDNVKQKTIEPFIKDTIESGTLVYTDEYSIYARLIRTDLTIYPYKS
jgi:transposase